jgi:hypothetical protein
VLVNAHVVFVAVQVGTGITAVGSALPAGSVMVTSLVIGVPARFHESVAVRVIV